MTERVGVEVENVPEGLPMLWEDARRRLVASGGEEEVDAILGALRRDEASGIGDLSPQGEYFLLLSKERARLGDSSFLEDQGKKGVKKALFRGALRDSAFGRGLQELKEDPTKVIRKISLDDLALSFGERRSDGMSDKEWRAKTIALAAKAKALYDELDEKYGIRIAKKVVVGYDENEVPVVYVITQKINGYDLGKDHKFRPELQEEVLHSLNELYGSWLEYFSDKYRNGDYFAWDIAKNWQYVLGEIEGRESRIYPAGVDNGPRAGLSIYLVDTDFRYISRNKERVFSCLSRVAISIQEMETRTGTRFVKIRSRFSLLISAIPPEEKSHFHAYMETIERFLEK